ncbi:MAG: hypothetical protein MUO58_14640 [Anaerolineales bacterium]|nr:hypothetical protein [Anaerolineales bacterium]
METQNTGSDTRWAIALIIDQAKRQVVRVLMVLSGKIFVVDECVLFFESPG